MVIDYLSRIPILILSVLYLSFILCLSGSAYQALPCFLYLSVSMSLYLSVTMSLCPSLSLDLSFSADRKMTKQAGAELCQAQLKLRLDFN